MTGSASPRFLTPGGWRAQWVTLWPGWQAEGPAWLQTRLRRIYRRWVYACTAWMAVLMLFWFVHADDLQEVWRAEQSVEDLRHQVASRPVVSTPVSQANPAQAAEAFVRVLDPLPGQSVQARLWPALQQFLERHHLKLLSWRPVPEGLQAPLPSQAIALRLRGHFGDWAQAWVSLDEGVPVWSMDRVRIGPHPDSDQVDIEVQLRVWLRSDLEGPLAWQGRGGALAPSDHAGMVFVRSKPEQPGPHGLLDEAAQRTAQEDLEQAARVSPDPIQWPWAEVRLVGVWQEGGVRHAILACGPHWVRARIGQRVSREGHRLETIGDQTVVLRAGQGPVQVLNFEKGPR